MAAVTSIVTLTHEITSVIPVYLPTGTYTYEMVMALTYEQLSALTYNNLAA
jgi:hypothetical protein